MEHSRLLLFVLIGILVMVGLVMAIKPSESKRSEVTLQSANYVTVTEEEADAFFHAEDWKNAAAAYQQIAAADQANGNAWFRLGFSLHRLGRFTEAVPAYEKALELGVTPLRTMISLVRAHSLQKQLDLAFDWLNKALDAGFSNVPILNSDLEFANLRGDERFQGAVARADKNARPCEYDPHFRQFDFWVGDWDVFDPQGNKVGENSIKKISNGCALLESWINLGGIPGSSLNYYSTDDQQWHQIWVDSSGGSIVISGGLHDGSIVMEGENIQTDGSKRPFRGAWTLLDDGRVRQFFEESQDAGATWYTWFEGFYVRK